jgi:cellulose synthase/poly-beta-1,6-N-acetylglucosamine synthase-like glycosyltransferase
MTRADLDSSLIFVAFFALISALLTLRAVSAPHRLTRPVSEEGIELIGASAGALLATALVTGALFPVVPVFLLSLSVAAVARYAMHRFSMPGILWLTSVAVGSVMSSLWSIFFILEADLPALLQGLALTGLGLSLLVFLSGQISGIAREAVLTHELWRRPTAAPAPILRKTPVKVSLQLCCYAEPPEIVKETMNRLAALDYDDYEVLVCDNNTKDEALWRPLEAHCALLNERLGRERFRFFHVAPLPGAKAGALNFCLEQMDQSAELIAVIDADYFSRKDFLSRLVPFFDDPKIGYVQTPHDYRDYEDNAYLKACYWEYMPTNKVDYPGVSEYGGAFTIGTMCVLRVEALRKAGGWAEWCLTEDSEVSVRLRAAGYRGLYIGETFGRGLIPDTFDDYRKQRFRWTAGPVQQLRRHWRLFLPAPFAAPLPGWTKLLEVTRCITPLQTLFGLVLGIIGMIMMVVALATGRMEPIDVPRITGLLLVLGAGTWWVRTMHRYKLSGCHNTEDMIRGEIARASLNYVVLGAGVRGLSRKPIAWRRTPKFAGLVDGSPFASTMSETVAGSICLFIALGCLLASDLLGGGMALLSFVAFAGLAAQCFCAPLMAALAIREAQPDKEAAPARYVPRGLRPAPAIVPQPGQTERAQSFTVVARDPESAIH